jgi:hypothetical protein
MNGALEGLDKSSPYICIEPLQLVLFDVLRPKP